MARPKQTIPSVMLNIAIPEPLAAQLQLHLYSDVEQRVPMGAYKALFASLLENYFKSIRQPCGHCTGTGVGSTPAPTPHNPFPKQQPAHHAN